MNQNQFEQARIHSPIRWGIIATGNIAHAMANALNASQHSQLLAVASRRSPSAQHFAKQHRVERAYASYQALLDDEQIDAVYIATPHMSHAELVLGAHQAGKHVLCEKPLCLNAAQVESCVQSARKHQRFLMEAVWMRFFPAVLQVQRWLAAGEIGEIRWLSAHFDIELPFDPQHRLYNRTLGGGALLDLGLYPLSLCRLLLGEPTHTHGHALIGSTGVDECNHMTLHYPKQVTAVLSSSMRHETACEAIILGDNGSIRLPHRFFCPTQAILQRGAQAPEVHDFPLSGNGYEYELAAVEHCLRQGQLECEQMPWHESLALAQQMDQLRRDWGVHYEADEPSGKGKTPPCV